MKILKSISKKLSVYSIYDCEVIEFCLKLWLSTIFQSVCMLIISLVLFDIYYFFSFFVFFFPLRLMFEGYHSKTFMGCFAVSNIIYLLICTLALITFKNEYTRYIAAPMILISAIYFICCTLKKMTECKKGHIREVIYIILRFLYVSVLGIYLLACLYLKINNVHIYVAAYSFCTVFILSILRGR